MMIQISDLAKKVKFGSSSRKGEEEEQTLDEALLKVLERTHCRLNRENTLCCPWPKILSKSKSKKSRRRLSKPKREKRYMPWIRKCADKVKDHKRKHDSAMMMKRKMKNEGPSAGQTRVINKDEEI
ncbi:hypothetical protein Tco_0965493 [Tanacetum coccineum]